MSPRLMDKQAAAMSSSVRGLLNCVRKRRSGVEREPAFSVLGPYCFKRSSAAGSESPLSVQERSCRASPLPRHQKVFSEVGERGCCSFSMLSKVCVIYTINKYNYVILTRQEAYLYIHIGSP